MSYSVFVKKKKKLFLTYPGPETHDLVDPFQRIWAVDGQKEAEQRLRAVCNVVAGTEEWPQFRQYLLRGRRVKVPVKGA
jgi:hypothetical protein